MNTNKNRNLPGQTLKLALLISASLLLFGCGGGGASNDTSASDPAQATADPRSQKLIVNWETESGVTYNLFWSTDPELEPENYASFSDSGMAADIQPPYTLSSLENNRNYYLYLESDNGNSSFSERFGTRPNGPAVTGSVNAIERDSQGNLYLGGLFTSVGYNAGGLIALNLDTELPTHSAYVGGLVTDIEPDGSGGFYVAGTFEHADGQEVNNILRLNPDLSLDSSWSVTTDDLIYTIAVETDRILIGGFFTEVNGVARQGLAAVNHDGEVLGFTANLGTNEAVIDIVFTEDHIIVGGTFSEIDGVPRDNLAALTPDGDADLSWQADADNQVTRMVQYDDILYITGSFENVDSSSRIAAAALDSEGTVLDFDPQITSGFATALAVIDDVVYIGGLFEGLSDNLIAWGTDNNPVSFATGDPNEQVTLIRELDGNILISGIFTEIAGDERVGMALLNKQGELQEGLQTGIQAAFGYHRDEDTLLLGTITAPNYQTVRRNNLAKLTEDGDVATWETGLDDTVDALALQSDTLYAGGEFTETDASVVRMHLAAFDPTNGELDSNWTPQADGDVLAMIARGGELHIGGEFDNIAGSVQSHLATLDADGNFIARMPEPDGSVSTMARDGANLYIAGDFGDIDGNTRNKVAAVNSTDGDVLSWAPDLTHSSMTMLVEAIDVFSGDVYLGGRFDEANGNPRNNLAAYDTAGAPQPWNPGADDRVLSILANATGIRIGGLFDQAGGTAANQLARIDSDGDTVVAVEEGGIPPQATTMIEVDGGFCLGGSAAFIMNEQLGSGIACLDDDLNWLW